MTQKKKASPPKEGAGFGPRGARTKLVVERAGLVGMDWLNRKISTSIYLMPSDLCHDLSYWLNVRAASIVGKAKPNGEQWDSLCCWPGRGMFVVKLRKEADV